MSEGHTERLNAALQGRYHIERQLGEGGMATVYLARDEKHNRSVALKVLKPELAAVVGAERFLAEIKTTANLQHPHILQLYDSGETDSFLYFVMPYVYGESLRVQLTKEKQLPVADAIQITREIADALAYAHEQGVIHRDVKPANIMLEAGHAVLADFGVAHAMAEARDERLTRTGTSLGTPAYMSPEQSTGERDLDGRSDQYALGCVLYEMLAGQPPFVGPAESVVRQHLVADPPQVSQIRSGVPKRLTEVLGRMLAKTPADRFGTKTGLVSALSEPAHTRPAPVRPKAIRVALAVAVAAALLALGLLSMATARGSEDPRPLTPREPGVLTGPQKLHSSTANRRSLSPKSSVGGRSPLVKTSRPTLTVSASRRS